MACRILLLFLLLTGCARVLPPEGGEKDTTPPVLRTELSTPDQQTNFRPTEIRLVFDEWIQLKDPLKQVVISPPLKKAPLVTSEGKAVVVQFNADEPWKDSTTYTLQFGKAITDRNEGNVTPDVRYVFSTGPVIDSLSAGGVLLDARSRAPVADALVLLHRDTRDSAVTLQLPDHYARTDKNGRYRLENLREGSFRVFALLEKSANYLYDLPDERIGFLPEVITIDSSNVSLPLITLSPPVKQLRVVQQDSSSIKGAITFAFSRPPGELIVPASEDGEPVVQWLGDTLIRLWSASDLQTELILPGVDTLPIHLYPDSTAPLPIIRTATNGKQPPGQELILLAPTPLLGLDTAGLQVWQDSIRIPITSIRRSEQGDSLYLGGIGRDGSLCRILVRPGTLEGINGQVNQDSLIIPVNFMKQDELVNLRLVIDSLSTGIPVILELMNGSQQLGRWRHEGTTQWILPVPGVLPGAYQVYLSLDLNRNGFWDGADLYKGFQAEPRTALPLTGLRANWEMEIPLVPDWGEVPSN
ncbi:MAG: Ig-like domain-containing protein [Lewinellaceae bacterium]|nr:Ig-like domain-containing protein [Saprospiraceae bacterium]MCB9313204.1 Ig-like domain-containing protein [Lewinellaceae bacterium]